MFKTYTFNEYCPVSAILVEMHADGLLTSQQYRSLRGGSPFDAEMFLRRRAEKVVVEGVCPCCGAEQGEVTFRVPLPKPKPRKGLLGSTY